MSTKFKKNSIISGGELYEPYIVRKVQGDKIIGSPLYQHWQEYELAISELGNVSVFNNEQEYIASSSR